MGLEQGRADSPADDAAPSGEAVADVPLRVIAREWGRIGVTGFGGPPAHIALLRGLCVTNRRWIPAGEFEDAIAACNLLPGPASTQLAIWCGYRLRGRAGAVVAGLCFICPGLVMILALAALFLAAHPPTWVLGAAAGAGAAVPAVAVHAAWGLAPASWNRIQDPRQPGRHAPRAARVRWIVYALIGGAAAATIGPYLVLILIACGVIEIGVRIRPGAAGNPVSPKAALPLALPAAAATGGLAALAWTAFKVGALSYGGGFVIIPLMQHDAVSTYHWMTGAQFLDAVALGQITPGPVVLTTGVVGYAAAGIGGGLLAVAVAFSPSFAFILLGGRHFDRLRRNQPVQAFLTGAGPTVIGAIAGSAIPLARALSHDWQYLLLAAAALWLFAARRGVVSTLLLAAACGVIAALAGAAVS
ncbi:chromate efflux transporter [Actinospica sp. MGRD01-02]|uniref:Chromate efflux transporter n=1 Tax=Actinospica acidithermotolerans TaxID=2828514 RepID=A0A941ECT2_9ACTN|nr:chromate efflux transporter [Actinospica acidithermotolerans]MBR7826659.1 chromate efflux transporter [Actinospica acidithermotolerans]